MNNTNFLQSTFLKLQMFTLSREIKLAVFYPEKEEVLAGGQLCFPSFRFLGEAKDGNAIPTVYEQQEVKEIFPTIYTVPVMVEKWC